MSPSATPPAPGVPSPWLFGPAVDLLFGYGLLYLISVPPLLVWSLRAGDEAWLGPALALLISIPHYGATILRVYERREDRIRFRVFTLWISAILLALFAASLWVGLLGSILLTAYVTWSPWHFSGQNYGLFVMYLRRAGVNPTGFKRPLYASFVASAVVAILGVHVSAGGDANFSIEAYDATGTFQILPLGIPATLAAGVAIVAAAFWLACLAQVARHVVGSLGWAQLAPLGVLMAMQSLWYLPSIAILTGLFDVSTAGFAFTAVWIATAHAIQYLWVTFYFARREGRHRRLASFYGKTWLAGAFLLTPTLLLAPGLFGAAAPNAVSVAVLTIAVLNLHHFVLDGAIWKLRDGRVARILLREDPSGSRPEPIGSPSRWRPVAAAVWTVAFVMLAARAYTMTLLYQVSREDVSLETLQRAAPDLAWLGQDTPGLWARLGDELERAERPAEAARAYARAVRKGAAPEPWVASRLAWLILERDSLGPRPLARVEELAEYLVQRLGDSRPEGYQTLAEVRARQGRWNAAIEAAASALEIARAQEDPERADHIAEQMREYRRQRVADREGATEGSGAPRRTPIPVIRRY